MFRIVKIKTCGMKGLDKNVTLQFHNETINYSSYSKAPSVKALFGTNGSGKSSFINALDTYKRITQSSSYLLIESESRTLRKLINKKTEAFSISIWFSNISNKETYCHRLLIDNHTQRPYIAEESISVISGKTINEGEKIILKRVSGNITEYPNIVSANEYLKKSIEKLSQYSSAVSLFSDINFIQSINEIKPKHDALFDTLLSVHLFSRSISVYMDNSDRYLDINDSNFNIGSEFLNISWKGNSIAKKYIEKFEKQVSRMAKFIKLYKPSLKDIEIDKTENEDIYVCKLIMKYDGYSVDSEYESTGIKNLMNIFTSLDNASRGGISFIDEMDANMSEVFLTKLCEYFAKYSKGQICFTTHNTSPMKILKRLKRGIDFINGFSECVTWKRVGNSNPANLFTDGMIEGIPLNIEDFSFAEVFSE